MSSQDFIERARTADDYFYGVGALGAIGHTDELRELFCAYLEAGHDSRALYETVLQLYLFAGYPRAINALTELHQAGVGPLPDCPQPTAESLERWREDGEALCARIYGNNYPKLVARMNQLSPELASWMILEGYGKVLSRPELPAISRECSVIGALTALGVERQLTSHLLGSLNLGLSAEQIRRGIALLECLLPAHAVASAQGLLDRLGTLSR